MPNAVGHERQCVARAVVRQIERDPDTGKFEPELNRAGNVQYRRCRKFAIRGGTVCDTHGGSTKHVKNAARGRLVYARDLALERVIQELDNLDAEIALRAATLAMKHAPDDQDDDLGGLRSALDDIKDALREME